MVAVTGTYHKITVSKQMTHIKAQISMFLSGFFTPLPVCPWLIQTLDDTPPLAAAQRQVAANIWTKLISLS